jgi:hypothetical protein
MVDEIINEFDMISEARRNRIVSSPTLEKLALTKTKVRQLDSKDLLKIREVVSGTRWDDSVQVTIYNFPDTPSGTPVGTSRVIFRLKKARF